MGVKGVLIGFILNEFCFVWYISPMLFIVFFLIQSIDILLVYISMGFTKICP